MKIIDIKCPHCDGELEFDLHKGRAICPYCGSSLYFDDESRTITHIEVIRDEARIKDAETNRIRVKHQINKEREELEAKRERAEIRAVIKVIWILAAVFFFYAIFSFNFSLWLYGLCALVLHVLLGIYLFISHF